VPHLRRRILFGIVSPALPGFPVELGGFGKLHAPLAIQITATRKTGKMRRGQFRLVKIFGQNFDSH
jgi:hypothetical protein